MDPSPDSPAASTPEELAARARAPRSEESRLGLIWGLMIASVLVYAALAYTLAPRYAVEFDDTELRGWLLMFLGVTAGLHALTALLLRQVLASFTGGRYLVFCLLRWALMEGIGIYGLICAFLGVDPWIHGLFYVAALALLLNARPGGTDRAIFVRQFE